MSYSLASSLKAILPNDVKIENTVGQTLLLAPMRKDVEEMDRKASEDLEKKMMMVRKDRIVNDPKRIWRVSQA